MHEMVRTRSTIQQIMMEFSRFCFNTTDKRIDFPKVQRLCRNNGTRWTLVANIFQKEYFLMSSLRCVAVVWVIGFLRNIFLKIYNRGIEY